MKMQVTMGTIWQDRGNGKRFEVTGFNKDTGVIQVSAIGNGDGYKTMSESSLRKNYKLIALNIKELELTIGDKIAQVLEEVPVGTPVAEPEQVVETHTQPEQVVEKATRATLGRVQLEDGSVIAGAKFITVTCGQKREDTYKVDSPIRWLLKPTGQALLAAHAAKVVYGEKITTK
jgi:hypothetical protein